MNMKRLGLVMLLMLGLAFSGCQQGASEGEAGGESSATTTTEMKKQGAAYREDKDSQPNAWVAAQGIEELSTLVTAIKAAGVENAVANEGPLTIFAPTNDAFAKIDKKTLEDLLKPENKDKLANILVNHVAPSKFTEEMLRTEMERGRKIFVASGNYLPVEEKDGALYIGGAKILKSAEVSNGIVYFIDSVILPE